MASSPASTQSGQVAIIASDFGKVYARDIFRTLEYSNIFVNLYDMVPYLANIDNSFSSMVSEILDSKLLIIVLTLSDAKGLIESPRLTQICSWFYSLGYISGLLSSSSTYLLVESQAKDILSEPLFASFHSGCNVIFFEPNGNLWITSSSAQLIKQRILESYKDQDTGGLLPKQGPDSRVTSVSKADDHIRLFCSYSHRDERLRQALESYLVLLQRQGFINQWSDRQISPGQEWDKAIQENLETADLILLLVSQDFLASAYAYEKEMERAVERHDKGEARVIPIILRPSDWHSAPFAKLQALPTHGKAVIEWKPREKAWLAVAQGIRQAIQELRAREP